MPSNSTILRNRWKTEDPEKYQAYLERQRAKCKERRDKKKQMWEEQPHTDEMVAKKEKEKEQTRNRVKKLRERKKAESRRVLRRSTDVPPPDDQTRKRPRDMNDEERRTHNAELRRQSRARQNPQKKRWAKVKAAQYSQKYRDRLRAEKVGATSSPSKGVQTSQSTTGTTTLPAAVVISSPPCPQEPPSQLVNALDLGLPRVHQPPAEKREEVTAKKSIAAKTLYNFTNFVKSKFRKKSNDPEVFAKFVRNLATPRTPQKKRALQAIGIDTKQPALASKSAALIPRQLFSRQRIRLPTKSQETAYNEVKMFYTREDISRVLPHKRYSTKAGPGYVMCMTLKEAFTIFKAERPDADVQFTKFTMLRPKNVRLVGQVHPETCACMYCLNVRHKKDTINKILTRAVEGPSIPNQLPPEVKMLDFLLCDKKDGREWHEPACLQGECERCSSPREKLEGLCGPYLQQPVTWQHWERVQADGRTKLDVLQKSGSLSDLLEEFIGKDLEEPSQNCTFVRHLFTFLWQYSQYSFLKNTLRSHEALMVMDFAENKKAAYSQEIKSAHFGKGQITIHPVVCFYLNDAGLMRHSLMFLSDDIQHDYHAVHHYTVKSIEVLKKAAPAVSRVFIFSDGCAGQYKGKGTFADLSLYTGMQVQRCFFGSEHGKGEADGETGVLSQALGRAVASGRTDVKNASTMFAWCQQEMSRSSDTFTREFFLVKVDEIVRNRPATDIVTVPGTRRIHQAERVSDYIIRTRQLACFCEACRDDQPGECINKAYTGPYVTHKLKHSVTSSLDEAFCEDNDDDREVEPQRHSEVPRVGDFIAVKYYSGKKELIYNAVVIPPAEDVAEEEIMVSFLKQQGKAYVFPDVPEICAIGAAEIFKILSPPTIDNRNRHYFETKV
ncbi:(S)-beta-bisabolene synthase [Plakobranchus ocellatus]|uniref:(S)-beta-bisabolene synthase n=1 Tax=Plakobranchus ocellatus TaxID=259542 RepID=A0AAV4AJM2_9GAST|nr:(S)-beta-bisabolene synthase [Plakobranchus ocellatus]